MVDSDSNTVKIPLSDGKSKSFMMWWIRLKAYAKVQRFSQALAATQENQPACRRLDWADVANKKATEAMDWNERALSNLAVAFTTPKAMVHFHMAASTEWPDGLACNVVKSLLRKHWPQQGIQRTP
jgi:hypothetical protein